MKNVPNILSALRIFLVPVFAAAYFYQSGSVKIYAAAVYAFATATDFLDGFIARRYGITSNLGKILDPIGDKFMTLTVLTCITIDDVIPVWALVVVLVKELIMIGGGVFIRHRQDGIVPPSNIFGKTSTVVFFIVCVALMIFKDIPGNIATIMISVAIVLMLLALVSYAITFINIIRKTNGNRKHT